MSGPKRPIRTSLAIAGTNFDIRPQALGVLYLAIYCELKRLPVRLIPRRWLPSRPHGETPLDHTEEMPPLPDQWAAVADKRIRNIWEK
jgi:hypothetical protein